MIEIQHQHQLAAGEELPGCPCPQALRLTDADLKPGVDVPAQAAATGWGVGVRGERRIVAGWLGGSSGVGGGESTRSRLGPGCACACACCPPSVQDGDTFFP